MLKYGIFLAWMIIGVIALRARGDGGWIIMITDPRNVGKATWLALPSLLVCWLLWPFNVSRYLFMLALIVGKSDISMT
jgi:hypothetical protein